MVVTSVILRSARMKYNRLKCTANGVPVGAGVQQSVSEYRLLGLDKHIVEAFPHPCLILDRRFRIVEANSLYTKATMVDRARVLGRYLFDVFPENPFDPTADGMRNVMGSFSMVLSHKLTHHMPYQRYDIKDRNGLYVERYWKPTNSPVLDKDGEVEFILQSVEDVTAVMKRFKPLFTTPRF